MCDFHGYFWQLASLIRSAAPVKFPDVNVASIVQRGTHISRIPRDSRWLVALKKSAAIPIKTPNQRAWHWISAFVSITFEIPHYWAKNVRFKCVWVDA